MLQNINKLNRGLESVIAVRFSMRREWRLWLTQSQVGNEFSQVEGLWSQFENVMAKQPESEINKDTKDGTTEEQNQ